MKTTEGVTVYQCDHCKKKLFRKYAMIKHEKFCTSNPENDRACSDCIFLEETTIDILETVNHGYGEEEIESTAKAFKCSKLSKMVYPRKVERLGLDKKYPETFEEQEPMPKECNDKESNFGF